MNSTLSLIIPEPRESRLGELLYWVLNFNACSDYLESYRWYLIPIIFIIIMLHVLPNQFLISYSACNWFALVFNSNYFYYYYVYMYCLISF